MLKINFFVGCFMIVATCFGQQPGITTKHGNTIINRTNGKGAKITFGQTILISVNTWLNDSLIQSTYRDNGGPREFTMPDSAAMADRVPAVFDAMFYLTNGDSATVLQPVDSIMKRGIPAEFGAARLPAADWGTSAARRLRHQHRLSKP